MKLGLSLGLSGRGGGGAFTPASLFASGEEGGWYDPSALTTPFTTYQGGTQAVPTDAVGLLLDKAQGLTLGSNLIANGDFSNGITGWADGFSGADASLVVTDGAGVLTVTSGPTAARKAHAIAGLTVGRTYQISVGRFDTSGSADFYWGWTSNSGGTGGVEFLSSAATVRYLTATATTMYFWFGFNNGQVAAQIILDDVTIKELPGNHALNSTSSARPLYGTSGGLFYLRDDAVDDAINATFPDLGTAATVAFASNLGVTIQTAQTIGAGAFDILRDQDLYAMIVINRALTAGETTDVTAYLNEKAGL